MKRILLFLLAFLLILPSAGYGRKKIGLVLGGGGAKGVAHIGVLKVLEEAGIPIDYIAGTSMGAIVGGLYSVGYSANEIDSLVQAQNWTTLLSDRVDRSSLSFPEKENAERFLVTIPFGLEKKDRNFSGVIKGQNLLNLFSNLTIGYHDSIDFNKLNIPFACVAVNLVDGKEYVFHNGRLPLAMRASMAIPAAFTPVRLNGMVLVDGGLNNNYPADVVREMGADIIIGVDLGTSDLKNNNEINTASDVLGQIIGLHGVNKYDQNCRMTDLRFRPNTSPYNAASFGMAALDTLIQRGEAVARSKWDEILAIKKLAGIDDSVTYHREPVANLNPDRIHIHEISFQGADPRDEKWLKQVCGIKENSSITLNELKNALSILSGTDTYSDVSYRLTGDNPQDLIFSVTQRSISSVSAGLRFDTEEYFAILLNGTLDYRTKSRQKLAFTTRIGERSSARLDYTIERTPLRNFNLAYQFSYQDIDLYNKGSKLVNVTYRHHFAEFGYSDMNWLSFKIQLGARYEYFDYNSLLYKLDSQNYNVHSERYFSYFALAYLETLDHRYFPSKGVSLRANYSLYTDDFVHYKGHTPFSALSEQFLAVIPISSRLALLPSLDTRILIGKKIGYSFLNYIGGDFSGRYLTQQLAFAGVNHIEMLRNSVAIARLAVRERISSNHYITLTTNVAANDDDFFHLHKGKYIWGTSLGYAFNTIAGPLGANFGISNRNEKFQFYLNLGYNF